MYSKVKTLIYKQTDNQMLKVRWRDFGAEKQEIGITWRIVTPNRLRVTILQVGISGVTILQVGISGVTILQVGIFVVIGIGLRWSGNYSGCQSWIIEWCTYPPEMRDSQRRISERSTNSLKFAKWVRIPGCQSWIIEWYTNPPEMWDGRRRISEIYILYKIK